MFHENGVALDIFGDKNKSDARRRCQPGQGASQDEIDLFQLYFRVTMMYTFTYAGRLAMPFCAADIDADMEDLGLPISLILEDDPPIDTPWGLARAYADETFAYMLENDGWNADGSMSRDYNRIPFSDYAYTDSDGNSWTPWVPENSPWEVR